MKQFLVTIAGVFAGLLLFFVGLPLVLITWTVNAAKPAPPAARTLLSLDLRQPLTDQDAPSPLAFLGARSTTVVGVVQTLRHAEHDGRVKGLLVRLPEQGVSPAVADELRLAIRAFRASGKPVLAHSQGLYASNIATSTYTLAAASGDFWMQSGSALQATGVASETVFLKGLFDHYGVSADYQQRYEYKNAVNPFLYNDYTPAHREAELSWMTSVYTSEVAEAAADRAQDPARLRAALEGGPWLAEEAVSQGLVDHIGDPGEAEAALRARIGGDVTTTDLNTYRSSLGSNDKAGAHPALAVIGAEGEITTGQSRDRTLNNQSGVFSDDLAKAFHDAVADRSIKAIVFRISSPGGSDTASEQILSAVRAAKAAGKPVVVSMGSYAASGGYWIASQASEIVAEPTTLTGSIGVFGGKFVLGPALARFGVDERGLKVGGDFADAFASRQPFTAPQRARISNWMDRIYDGFVQRVAEGRRLPVARVREIARGRVWTGAQAKALGLVDQLGGFELAVSEAKRLGGVPGDAAVELKSFPGRRSPLEAFQRMMGLGGASIRTLAAAAWVFGDPRAQGLMDQLMRARLNAQDTTVLAPRTLN